MTRRDERAGARRLTWMAGRSTGPGRLVALLMVGIFVAAGCGSATGQAPPVPTATLAASTITGGRPSGIAGQAVEIVCGGPASEQGCSHHPVLATIDVLRMPSRRRIATVRTDKSGRFRVDLPPGSYELGAHTSGYVVARVASTRVLPHQVTHTMITFVPRHPLPVAPGSASG